MRKIGLLVCATAIVGALAGVARSDYGVCYSTVFNNSGDVGACVQGAAGCLNACITGLCGGRLLKASCVQNCVTEFSFQQGACVGRFTNVTQPF